MSLVHRMSEPVRAPVRRVTSHYAVFFEDLIHAVKNEVVSKVDRVDRRVEDSDRSMTAAYEAVSDQLAIQTATIRSLGKEVARLQQLIDPAAAKVLDLSAGQTTEPGSGDGMEPTDVGGAKGAAGSGQE